MTISTHTPADASQAAAEAYFAALAGLRAEGEADRIEATTLLLTIAASRTPSPIRQRARIAIKERFGAVVEDETPELAAHIAAVEAERRQAAAEAQPIRQPRQASRTANDNIRAT